MKNLWLTYAWVDNEDLDIDFIVQEIEKSGKIRVNLDRRHIIAGYRLWDQVGAGISASTCDAWSIAVSKASLESQPCQEELAIALDKALRQKGMTFPLIGIMLEKIDSELVPPAIRTRKYVSITDPTWLEQLSGAVLNTSHPDPLAKNIVPFTIRLIEHPSVWKIVEISPRAGTMVPVGAMVPIADKNCLGGVITGTRGYYSGAGVTFGHMDGPTSDGLNYIRTISNPIDPSNSLHIPLKACPSRLWFLHADGEFFKQYEINLR